jgi:hypothetical protein
MTGRAAPASIARGRWRRGRSKTVKIAAAMLGTMALLNVAAPFAARATDIDDYRWDHDRPDCRVVETHTTNRWGDDVTVRRRVCG